jgi:hypothetical protein
MLKFSPKKKRSLQLKEKFEGKYWLFKICLFVQMETSKLINYSTNACWKFQGNNYILEDPKYSGDALWETTKSKPPGPIIMIGQSKIGSNSQVLSICTKFTIFTQWYEYHDIEMCDTRGVHSINMIMLI